MLTLRICMIPARKNEHRAGCSHSFIACRPEENRIVTGSAVPVASNANSSESLFQSKQHLLLSPPAFAGGLFFVQISRILAADREKSL